MLGWWPPDGDDYIGLLYQKECVIYLSYFSIPAAGDDAAGRARASR